MNGVPKSVSHQEIHTCARTNPLFDSQGQLGVKGLKDRFEPTLVTALCGKKVTDVICGQDHAFAIIKVLVPHKLHPASVIS